MAAPRHATIVVGIANPTVSQAPLQWAVEQARAFERTLLAVSVFPSRKLEPWPAVAQPGDESEAAARLVLDQAIEQLGDRGEGVELRREVVEGKPLDILVERSHDADLLVLGGRRARTPIDHRPRSVAARAIQLAACPVVVVPTAAPRASRRAGREGTRS